MTDFLDEKRREIQGRLKELKPLVDEYHRLEAAEQALELVKERPGITIPEMAQAMGIQQNYLYRVMPTLAEQGKVTKSGRGWHLREG